MGRGGGGARRGARRSGSSGSVSHSHKDDSLTTDAAAMSGFKRFSRWLGIGGGSSEYDEDNKYRSPWAKGGALHCETLQIIYDECVKYSLDGDCLVYEKMISERCGVSATANSGKVNNRYTSEWARGGPRHCELLQVLYNQCVKYRGEEDCWVQKKMIIKRCGFTPTANTDNIRLRYSSEWAPGGPRHCEMLQEIYDKCIAREGKENCWPYEKMISQRCGGDTAAGTK